MCIIYIGQQRNIFDLFDFMYRIFSVFVPFAVCINFFASLKFLLLINSLSLMKRFTIIIPEISQICISIIPKNSDGLRTIRHKAAVLWNELPVFLQEINSLSVFKNKLKQYLLLLHQLDL